MRGRLPSSQEFRSTLLWLGRALRRVLRAGSGWAAAVALLGLIGSGRSGSGSHLAGFGVGFDPGQFVALATPALAAGGGNANGHGGGNAGGKSNNGNGNGNGSANSSSG